MIKIMDPMEIEKRSFEIIEQETKKIERGYSLFR